MNVLIGCDVDPWLRRPGREWEPLDLIDRLQEAMASELPPITWLIRCDESVRMATGTYDSGFTTRARMWEDLLSSGHEIGWHMHPLSWNGSHDKQLRFDPEPAWLPAACAALRPHAPIRASRTGYDYGSNWLFRKLDTLKIELDFSALPGQISWFKPVDESIVTDWRRCLGPAPYHPDANDYQRPGPAPLGLLEVPITAFRNTPAGLLRRLAWRLWNGCPSAIGLSRKTLKMTDGWPGLPQKAGVWAFYFHAYDLSETGGANFVRNIERLRAISNVEFLTASEINRRLRAGGYQ